MSYTTEFTVDNPSEYSVINVGKARGVVEVFLTGEKLGTGWDGEYVFVLGSGLKKGKNVLKIDYTTTLGNYATTVLWSKMKKSIGLEGPVRIY